MAEGCARGRKEGARRGARALEEAKRRGETRFGFDDGLSAGGMERRGDACWHRRREAETARAEQEDRSNRFLPPV